MESPAPVIGGSRKMSWAGQTKAKKNWNPNKFAYRKTSAPNLLAAAATGPAGVGWCTETQTGGGRKWQLGQRVDWGKVQATEKALTQSYASIWA